VVLYYYTPIYYPEVKSELDTAKEVLKKARLAAKAVKRGMTEAEDRLPTKSLPSGHPLVKAAKTSSKVVPLVHPLLQKPPAPPRTFGVPKVLVPPPRPTTPFVPDGICTPPPAKWMELHAAAAPASSSSGAAGPVEAAEAAAAGPQWVSATGQWTQPPAQLRPSPPNHPPPSIRSVIESLHPDNGGDRSVWWNKAQVLAKAIITDHPRKVEIAQQWYDGDGDDSD
jgi:hypothetical protein